jgi:chemotaxis signal transduction protein
MNGREYALPAAAVRGMVELRGAESRVLGQGTGGERLATVEGRTLPLVELHALLGLRQKPVSARTCLILAAHPVDAIRPAFAFIADSISRIERVAGRNCRAESIGEWLDAQVRLGEKWRGVLNLARMARHPGSRAA